MSSCQCRGVEEEFGTAVARRQLGRFRRSGPKRTTRWLIDAIAGYGPQGLSLLDVGGGVGEIQHELAARGAGPITNVDASSAYQEKAREEAARRGYADRAAYHYGDFVDVSEKLGSFDIVTLDRVICCYDNVHALVQSSASRAREVYGVVFPRSVWWTRVGFKLINLIQRIRRASFRAFLHSPDLVENLLARQGFGRIFHRESFVWRVSVYARNDS